MVKLVCLNNDEGKSINDRLQHITRVSSRPAAWHSSSTACCAVPGSVAEMKASVVRENWVAGEPVHNDNDNDGHLQHIT